MTKEKKLNPKIERRFDEKFYPKEKKDKNRTCGVNEIKSIKQFLTKEIEKERQHFHELTAINHKTFMKTLKEQREETIKEIKKYQEHIQGGGNCRRLFIQLLGKLKKYEKQ